MDFLFELGLEEVPARMIAGAQAELLKRVVAMLGRERLVVAASEATSYSTPRRLAVLVRGVLERQQDVSEEVTGPAVKIAYKDGQPGPAAVAFANKSGVAVEELRIVGTPKGEYVAITITKAGRSASEVIAAELPKELAGIYWAKTMYWRAEKPERFVRPVRWIVALLGDELVPVSFGGYEAGRVSYGHRVLHGAEPVMVTPTSYAEALRGAFVEVDVEARRHMIRKALDRVCRAAGEGLRWRENHALVDKMTHLTEWPSVIAGGFEAAYLTLPEEVLVTVMRDHQNYFAVESKDGKLEPHFLAVLNTVADAAGEAVIRHGNERVLRARFNDARFFWEFDQRVKLEERVAWLEQVTFQKELGSYAAKSLRVAEVARSLAWTAKERGLAVDEEALEDAARLAKTDLTTELVKEFTELQGEVGGLYGKAQGLSAAASAAMYDQYRPTSMEDRIPRTVEGQLLAIADKADTIAGMFGLGLEPTGSKDPFALRRAANGIVKILGEAELPFDVEEVIQISGALGQTVAAMGKFFRERLEFYLREANGFRVDVVRAVMSVEIENVSVVVAQARALNSLHGSANLILVCEAFRRMKNILAQAEDRGYEIALVADGLHNEDELALAGELSLRGPEIENLASGLDFMGAFEEILKFGPLLQAFFEKTMVMSDDARLRASRLALVRNVLSEFSKVADFSEIVVAG